MALVARNRESVYSRTSADLPPGDGPAADSSASPSAGIDVGDRGESQLQEDSAANDTWLLAQADNIYRQSTDYLQANIEQGWAQNLAHFNSRHAVSSKFSSSKYRRSKVFRPKTRASIKSQESSLATAMFSTTNLINVAPQNSQDERQQASAVIAKALLQHRLESRMPWFLTSEGAFQDTKIYGVCISYQYWHYLARQNERSGANEVVQDELCCDLIEPENFRFDPHCDWRDPANKSPFLIMLKYLRVDQVQDMMEKRGGPWRDFSAAELLAAGSESRKREQQTQQAREGDRTTASDMIINVQGMELVQLRMNIIRIRGEDWVFWTGGSMLMLSDPKPLTDEYPHLRVGERPFVVGYSSIEAHKNYPESDAGQAAPLQQEINSIASQRIDNVDLVLQKRYFIKRGSQTDVHALARNIPGGAVFMSDPETDVKVVSTPDVTGSAYREHQVLDQEFDDLIGGFSPARNAGQSQPASSGAMAQASASAVAVQDYGIKTFIETWVEPVLRQLVRLEQMYETDENIITLAANQAKLFQKFGIDDASDALLLDELILRVDVGGGNLDPLMRVERLSAGVRTVLELPTMADRLIPGNVAREIFGMLGYRDETRYFISEEEYEQRMSESPPPPGEGELKKLELDIRREDNQMRDERERSKMDLERILAQYAGATDERKNELIQRVKLIVAQMSNKTSRDTTAVQEEGKRAKSSQDDKTKRDSAAVSALTAREQRQQQQKQQG